MSALSNLPGNRNSTPEGSNTLRPPQARSLIGTGHALRQSADMGGFANPLSNRLRPSSEVYFQNSHHQGRSDNGDDIDKATQQWLADIDQYEATLEEMATATLDQEFKDELSAIEQWFRVLSEAERTSALYALIQQTTQVQQRFFIQVLTEMAKNHPMSNILSPATFGTKDPTSQKFTDAMSKLTVEGSRNSVGLGQPPATPGNKRLSGLDPSVISSMFPDAANAIAKQKEQFTQQTGLAPASARNSMIAVGDRTSLVAPSISTPDDDNNNSNGISIKADKSMPPPSSPWTSTRAPDVQPPIQRPRSSAGQQSQPTPTMGQFIQPPPSAGLRSPYPSSVMAGGGSALKSTTLAAPENPLNSINHLLSPHAPGASWASMVNTPMVPNFNHQLHANNAADMVANATAMKLAALSTVNNRINFDDARKFQRGDYRARPKDSIGGGPMSPGLPGANFIMTNEHGQMLTTQQMAALQAQQFASITGGRSRPNSPGVMVTGTGGDISALNFGGMQANNGFLSASYNSPATTAAALAGLNLNQFGGNMLNSASLTHQQNTPNFHDGYISDHSEINRGRSPRGRRGSSKPPEDPTSIELLSDIPAWLKSLRLHKYTDQLKDMRWQDLVELDDKGLEEKGVAAVGARRKMLKVFEQVHELKAEGKM